MESHSPARLSDATVQMWQMKRDYKQNPLLLVCGLCVSGASDIYMSAMNDIRASKNI